MGAREMTPREAQVERVERALAIESAAKVGVDLPSLTAQQVDIAERAINLFAVAVSAVKPWTGLSDLTADELRAFRKQAIRALGGGPSLPF